MHVLFPVLLKKRDTGDEAPFIWCLELEASFLGIELLASYCTAGSSFRCVRPASFPLVSLKCLFKLEASPVARGSANSSNTYCKEWWALQWVKAEFILLKAVGKWEGEHFIHSSDSPFTGKVNFCSWQPKDEVDFFSFSHHSPLCSVIKSISGSHLENSHNILCLLCAPWLSVSGGSVSSASMVRSRSIGLENRKGDIDSSPTFCLPPKEVCWELECFGSD